MISENDIREVIAQFPPIEAAFAYGSGVIEQAGYSQVVYKSPLAAGVTTSSSIPMVDMIFVVDDSYMWHNQNKSRNASHYSTPVPMSARSIANIQDNYGAGLWYNTYVPMKTSQYPNRLMKYGVISKRNFLADLNDWKYLYIAGRLHKPVRVMQMPDINININININTHTDINTYTSTSTSTSTNTNNNVTSASLSSSISDAIDTNKNHAINTSLLLLPEEFSELELYLMVASLSYTGDPRMGIGENPNKVENLVKPILPIYQELYKDTLVKLTPSLHWNASSASFHQDLSPNATWKLIESLPLTLKNALSVTSGSSITGSCSSTGNINMSLTLSTLPPRGTAVQSALSSIVSRTAKSQTMKGILTAGVIKSAWYVAQKIGKRFGGLLK